MIKNLSPKDAFELQKGNPLAILVDVRTYMEHAYVGHPIGAIHIPWKEAPDWRENPSFIEDVKNKVTTLDVPVLLLCRSGQRSLSAAQVLEQAGFTYLVNIVDGFEGPLDANKHRGNLGGWRFCNLPWEQN